jgi:hypothetical protein
MVILVVLTVSLAVSVQNTGASPLGGFSEPYVYNLQYNVGGGDCSADRASGDLYSPPDPYCISSRNFEPLVGQSAEVSTKKPKKDTESPGNPPKLTNTPSPDPTQPPTEKPSDPPPTEKPTKPPKDKCDKGGGNGGEGCDPGENPDKGNDDEPGDCKDKDHKSPWHWPKKKH